MSLLVNPVARGVLRSIDTPSMRDVGTHNTTHRTRSARRRRPFFDLSFLVKDARATVGVDDSTGLPVCRLAEAPDGAVPKTQNVVVLSMADCKAIGELWGIEKPQLPREARGRERAAGRGSAPPPPPPDDGEVGRLH